MPPTDRVEVVVSVDDEHTAKLRLVAEALQKAGLSDVSAQEKIGTISGLVSEAEIAALKQVPGVLYIERSQTVFPA